MTGTVKTLAVAMALALGVLTAAARPSMADDALAPQAFKTPDLAMTALRKALTADDVAGLLRIFGADYAEVVLGVDRVSGAVARRRATEALDEGYELRKVGDDQLELVIGKQKWPMPIPLRRTPQGWIFDSAAGEEEIRARRIGDDELAAIATLKALAKAEEAYAARSLKKTGTTGYATFVQSTPGDTDGLWWDRKTAVLAGPSPLARFIRAQQEFVTGRQPGDPFRGYYFRILTGQGPHATGGAMSYVADGRMSKGFAAIAWPADYRKSGVMTLIIDKSGRVLQANLGEETSALVQTIRVYDPDERWVPAETK